MVHCRLANSRLPLTVASLLLEMRRKGDEVTPVSTIILLLQVSL